MPARVLLIDDDPGLSEVIELLLSREGYGVERAGTLKAGIARSGAAGIDLVITDLKLPDGTGLDANREIRGVHPTLRYTMRACAPKGPSFPCSAARWRAMRRKRSSSGTHARRAAPGKGSFGRPAAARCSSTKSPSSRRRSR